MTSDLPELGPSSICDRSGDIRQQQHYTQLSYFLLWGAFNTALEI